MSAEWDNGMQGVSRSRGPQQYHKSEKIDKVPLLFQSGFRQTG